MKLTADVLVVGGGTGGVVAALAAAREGADTIIVERDRMLGGTGTRAGIHHYYHGSLGGLQQQIDQRVRKQTARLGAVVHGFHPEAKQAVLAGMVAELNIRVIYGAVVSEVLLEQRNVCGVRVETEDGGTEIAAAVTIDATGDGDVAYLAGVPFTVGRAWDGAMHTYSMIPRFVDEKRTVRYKNFDAGWVDPTDAADLSRAYMRGRSLAWKSGEDARTVHYVAMSPQIGIREGRNVIGEYVLQHDDLATDRKFTDVVMHCASHYDNHAYDYANESEEAQLWVAVYGLWPQPYGGAVPYRCFVPVEADGLLIGCRALSVSRDAGIAFRMQRDIQKVGEVAGVAAALCARQGVAPRQLPIRKLQQRLMERGVLAQDALRQESLPWIVFDGERRGERYWPDSAEQWEREIGNWIQLLGTAQEGRALWWLRQAGAAACELLRQRLAAATGKQRRGVAFALALLDCGDGIDELLAAVQRRDGDRLGEGATGRCPERWVGALVLLKKLRSASAFAEAVQLLYTERRPSELLYVLHYMVAVVDQLEGRERTEQLVPALAQLLTDPELGERYELWGNHTRHTAAGSLRWNLEMTAGYLLECAGAEGLPWIERYLRDERHVAATMAERLLQRLKERKGGGKLCSANNITMLSSREEG